MAATLSRVISDAHSGVIMNSPWTGDRMRCCPISLRPAGQKNCVAGTTLPQPAAHALHFDPESRIAQALLEFPIFPGRPHGQHAIAFESGANGGQSAIVVEPAV